jgi:hypothetical protein
MSALVNLGYTLENLLHGDNPDGYAAYIHYGTFDRWRFALAFSSAFKGAGCPPATFELLGMMERDCHVVDIRWMAYMLATVYKESGRTMRPVDEIGRGSLGTNKKTGKSRGKLRYYLPIKIKRLSDGRVRVTEQDGDQFFVSADGGSVTGHVRRRGSDATRPATATYTADDGVERRYFGRGYVQITWWNTYVDAGEVLGRKLEFLFDPESVKRPATAYQIMSVGMRTGKIFANRRTLASFISGDHCDYYGARTMVNGTSGAAEIAESAKRFERAMLVSKDSVGANS